MAPRTPAPETRPRPRRRRSPQAQEDFRRQILDVARRIYREQGYEALSIRAVTEPLGVSQMAFYAYFPSKGELVRHIWADVLQEQLAAMQAAGEGGSTPEEALRAHLHAYLDYWRLRPDQYRQFMSEGGATSASEVASVVELQAYRQITQLHRDRVLACIGPARLPAARVEQLAELAYVKAIGYLHATLGVGRYPFSAPAELQRWVVDDIVEGILRAGWDAGPSRAHRPAAPAGRQPSRAR